ncbi:MAG: DUF6259 domain-containing protein [Pirellulaceae bacterium]
MTPVRRAYVPLSGKSLSHCPTAACCLSRSLVRSIVWLLCAWIPAAAMPAEPSEAVLENACTRVVFETARGGLQSLEDKTVGHNHRDAQPAGALWILLLGDGRTLGPVQAGTVSFLPMESAGQIAMRWADFHEVQAPDLVVTARITLDAETPVSRWRISLTDTGNLAVRSLYYPRLTGIARQDREVLAVPVWMGEQTRRARQLLNGPGGGTRQEWSYPGILSLQCLAFYAEQGPGLLLSTDDTATLRKQFAVSGDGHDGLSVEVEHVPPTVSGSTSFEPPYAVVVRLFRGDWYSAAEYYRAWARQQWWVEQSRLRRGSIPAWVLDTGLWQWNRGRSAGVLTPAIALQEAAGVPVSVFWHWWHGCPYDAGFPEYLPPREGADPFRDAVGAAQQRGVHSIVYMNQRLWGMTTRSWQAEGAERFAVKSPDGTVAPEVYNTFMKVPCASMCMGTDFWRAKYAGLAAEAICDLGVDGIYMDQACSSLACYDRTHGHPLGGGVWWMQGFHALESDIRRRCSAAKQVALAGEGCGEAWLPHLDLMLSLQVSMERYAAPREWEPIPFFQAVYHDCAVLFGNYSSLTRPPYDDLWPSEYAPTEPLQLLDEKFAGQFCLEQGRSFVWGQQPTIANFRPEHLVARPAEMDFVMRIARLRRGAQKYLRDGVFLRPPDTGTSETTIPISRLSIYAGQQEPVQEYTKAAPLVLSSAWQAADGSVAVALANLSHTSVPVHLALEPPDYPLASQGVIRQILPRESVEVGRYQDGRASLDIMLDPVDVRIYEFLK